MKLQLRGSCVPVPWLCWPQAAGWDGLQRATQWGCSQSGMHQHVLCQLLHHPVYGGKKKPWGYSSVPTYYGKCNQAVPDPAETDACDPCASCPASQLSAGARAQSVKARRFVPRRTRAGFAFATVNPNSSWSMGQLSWEECFQSHGALGLMPGLPMGAGTGEGCRSWRCKDMWGSLAQPMLLPGPGKQSRRIWMHIFSPIEFAPRILTLWQYLV